MLPIQQSASLIPQVDGIRHEPVRPLHEIVVATTSGNRLRGNAFGIGDTGLHRSDSSSGDQRPSRSVVRALAHALPALQDEPLKRLTPFVRTRTRPVNDPLMLPMKGTDSLPQPLRERELVY